MEPNISSREEPNIPNLPTYDYTANPPPIQPGGMGNPPMGAGIPTGMPQPGNMAQPNLQQPTPGMQEPYIPPSPYQNYYYVIPESNYKEGMEDSKPLPKDISFKGKDYVKEGCPMGDRWLCSLILLIIFLVGMFFGVASMYATANDEAAIPVFVFSGVIYIIYLIESCFSETPSFLSNIKKDARTEGYLEKLKQVAPHSQWTIQNYHYETRVEHYRDKDGKDQTRTTTIRINTFYNSKTITYPSWNDLSPKVEGLDSFKVTRLYCHLNLVYSNSHARNKYYKKLQKWRAKNIMDMHHDFHEYHHLSGMDAYTLSINGEKSDFLKNNKGKCKFCLATLFFYGWFIRFYLFKHSKRLDYSFVKLIHKIDT